MYAQEISASRFVELSCRGVIKNIILFHKHTRTILFQNFTNNFFLQTTCNSRATF